MRYLTCQCPYCGQNLPDTRMAEAEAKRIEEAIARDRARRMDVAIRREASPHFVGPKAGLQLAALRAKAVQLAWNKAGLRLSSMSRESSEDSPREDSKQQADAGGGQP